MSTLPVAALLLVAGQLDVDATVVAEARGGEAPLRAGAAPRGGVVGVLTPGGDLELRRTDSSLRLDYAARIFWRQPNESGACPVGALMCESRLRPLILHSVTLAGTARASNRVRLTGGGSLSIGEADYSVLPQLVGTTTGTTQATLPSVVDIFTVSATAGAEVAVTRIWTVGTMGEVSHRRPLGTQDPASTTLVLPRQTLLRAEPTATARLSRQDDLLLMSPISYQTYSQTVSNQTVTAGTSFLIITPEVGWRTHLTRRYDLRLHAGVAYVRILGTLPPNTDAPGPIGPVGGAEFQARVIRQQGVAMHLTLGTTVDYYVDPILAVAAPRGTAYARSNVLFSRNWTVGIEGLFATNLTARPLQVTAVVIPPTTILDETVASIWIPARHRVSDNLILEFGARWSDRAPHLQAQNFAFHQREIWAYVMLTATTRRLPEWLTP